ncbi:hypothetical protein CPB83DRAFT_862864 [Crepidotus variabilis]|uniref:Uncharacterized protein n=1 Tax=Crepidotus variabilis TaxID=179855 RepID=A0A9P6E6I5_9AGAR|nr:hypothetical protein CPB83DRAFT_862864 [Crepidotus variabilis]
MILSKKLEDELAEFCADGGEIVEWKEGRHRVIEKRARPGDDVEVIVIDEEKYDESNCGHFYSRKWRGKWHDFEKNAEGIIHSLRKELGFSSKK